MRFHRKAVNGKKKTGKEISAFWRREFSGWARCFFTCGILSDAAWISAICCFCRFRLPCCSAGGKLFIMDIRRRYNGWPGFGASALP